LSQFNAKALFPLENRAALTLALAKSRQACNL
jgi:hypothetical protein